MKRAVEEPESAALVVAIDRYFNDGAAVLTSSLTRIEVSRALRALLGTDSQPQDVTEEIARALTGVAVSTITEDVVALTQRVAPSRLRTLDAIHLATAVLRAVDLVVTYDLRLAEACRHNGLAVEAP